MILVKLSGKLLRFLAIEMGQVELSMVVPAFNEGNSIENALTNLGDVFKCEKGVTKFWLLMTVAKTTL